MVYDLETLQFIDIIIIGYYKATPLPFNCKLIKLKRKLKIVNE